MAVYIFMAVYIYEQDDGKTINKAEGKPS